ncbi:hypothetical protein OC844_006962, partial [Tilletia horrida]
MRLSVSTLLHAAAAALAVSPALVFTATVDARAPDAGSNHAGLQPRGEIQDIVSTIRAHKCGLDFCSTFLHLPAPTTKTVTVTSTVSRTVPGTTVVKTTAITSTASPVTRTQVQPSIVKVTPTVQQTVVSAVPSTST